MSVALSCLPVLLLTWSLCRNAIYWSLLDHMLILWSKLYPYLADPHLPHNYANWVSDSLNSEFMDFAVYFVQHISFMSICWTEEAIACTLVSSRHLFHCLNSYCFVLIIFLLLLRMVLLFSKSGGIVIYLYNHSFVTNDNVWIVLRTIDRFLRDAVHVFCWYYKFIQFFFSEEV